MKTQRTTTELIGRGLLGLVGLVLVAAGAAKATGLAPAAMTEPLARANLADWQTVIGCGAVVTGLLLWVPVTVRLGSLLSAAYWGGAIVTHMTLDEPFVPPAALLAMTLAGAALVSESRLLARFRGGYAVGGGREAAG